MIIGKIKVSGTTATVDWSTEIPKGLVGGKVQIEYTDDIWSGLNKTVVFRSSITRDVLENGSEVIIPADVLERSGVKLYVGVYGTDAENNLGLPTFWANLGVIRDAADPEADPNADSSLPVWARLLEHTPDWLAPPGTDDHILNRTHWKETKVANNTYDGSLEGRKYVTLNEGTDFVKISDVVLSDSDLIGASVTLHSESESEAEEDISIEITEDMIYDLRLEMGVPVIAAYEFVMCVLTSFSLYGINVERGVYFLRASEDGKLLGYVKSFSALPDIEDVYHKLDSKYLDAEWVANRSDGSEIVLQEATQEFYSGGDCRQTFPFGLEPGEDYVITWDGEEHTCTCSSIMLENFVLPCMGNMHFFNDEYPDTGEPFGIVNIAILYFNLGTLVFARPTDGGTTHTVAITRTGNIRNRIPLGYMPATYTFPSDLCYNDIDSDQLSTAYLHLQNGGQVKAMYQNDLYNVLAINLDVFDGWYDSIILAGDSAIRIWQRQKGWLHYESHRFTLCTSSYDEIYKYGKKFEITVSEDGVLQTRDITGYTTT